MRKFLSISFVMLCLALGLTSRASTIEFTYAEGELFGYGQGMKENIDVAIRIDNPSLAGMKIKNIKAYLSGAEGFENTSVWMSSALNLVDKVNVPDIASYAVAPVSTTYGDGTLGMLSIDLPEPYELTREPLYIGYSLTVADNTAPEQKYPIVVSEGSNPNGLFLHMSKSVLKWMDYSTKAQGVAYIVVTLEGDIEEYSLAITDYKEANVIVGKDFDMEVMVNNPGLKPVGSVKYSYSVDDGELMEGFAALPSSIEPDVTVSVPLTLNFKGIDEIGPHILKLRIDEVDGHPNGSSSAYRECLVNVMPYVPVHRPLVEEFTGLWCGWCPRGWVGMEMLGENYGENVVIVCYHNNDGMAVTSTYPVDFSGYPNAALNRGTILDPYYGTYDDNYDFGISYDVENSMAEMTMADIKVDATLEGSKINVVSTIAFMKDIHDGNYRVGYVLTANGLSKPYWIQSNYYAGMGEQYKDTYLEPLTEMPKSIMGMVFNDVAVDVSATDGIEDSLPSEIKTAETYSNTYVFDIAGNELAKDGESLVVNAFVIDMNTGLILNSDKVMLEDPSGIGGITVAAEVISTEFYNLNGTRVGPQAEGVVIKRERLSDGTFRTSKIINRPLR